MNKYIDAMGIKNNSNNAKPNKYLEAIQTGSQVENEDNYIESAPMNYIVPSLKYDKFAENANKTFPKFNPFEIPKMADINKRLEEEEKKRELTRQVQLAEERIMGTAVPVQERNIYYKSPEVVPKPLPNTPLQAGLTSFLDSATLGASSTLQKKYAPQQYRETQNTKIENPVASTIGTIGGYVIPGIGAEKLATKALTNVLPKIGSNIGKRALIGGTAGGGMELAEGLIRGENAGDIAKRTAIGTGLGAIGEVAIGGILSKLRTGKTLNQVEKQTLEEVSKTNPQVKAEVEKYILKKLDTARFTPKKITDELGLNIDDYSKITNEYKLEKQNELNKQINYLKNSQKKGVTQGMLVKDTEGNVVNRIGRVSNNEKWYQDFYRENKRPPNKKEFEKIAENQLKNGYESNEGFVPPSEYYNSLDNEINNIANKTKPLLTQKKNYSESPLKFKNPDYKGGMRLDLFSGAKKTKNTPKFEFSNPNIEFTYQTNKGIRTPSFVDKIKEGITNVTNSFTRVFPKLKPNKENAEIIKDLVRIPKLKSIAGSDTVNVLDGITKDMDKNTFDLFSRKVLLDDLAEEAKLGNKLPNQFTPETLKLELERVNQALPDTVVKGLNNRKMHWDEIKADYIESMNEIGIDMSDKFTKENYFRHQVLDYMDSKAFKGMGNKLKSPANRGFSKARSGEYEGDINTDYLQAEYEVMAQMKHDTEIAKIIKNIDSNYNIAKKVKADAKQQDLKNWEDAIPEGYTTWQPKEGNVFYQVDTIPSRIAKQLENKLIDEWHLSADEVGKALAIGGKRKEFVIKQEIADTLEDMFKNQPSNVLADITQKIQSTWKGWVLTGNPKSVIKYNIRNFSGDLDPIITGNPSTLTKIPKASTELWDAMKNKKVSLSLQDFIDRGGFQNTLYAQEVSQVNSLKPFERFKDKKLIDYAKIPLKPIKKYQEIVKDVTNYRELVGRYAAYLDYKDQIYKNGGKPKNYGASKPDVINGLKSVEDKAYKLSNDLLGAYDEVSQSGQVIRRQLIPFYSWMEVNLKRYKQLAQNIIKDGTTTEKIGKGTFAGLRLSGKVAYNVGKLVLGTSLMSSSLALWNNTKYPELEDTLPTDVKARPHIILGQDKEGNTLYFSRLGALNDFMEWFGMGTITQDVKDVMDGKITLKEQAIKMSKQPINKIVSGITPLYKTPAELLTGRKTYPDVFKPSNIRDKGQYAAQSIGLSTEYNKLTGKPSRLYFKSLSDAVIYKSDPKESAYYQILDAKRNFDKKIKGDTGEMFFNSPKSNALYNYKLALKLKDTKAADKYLNEYSNLGGTEKGLTTSLKSMNPLYGLDKKEEKQFIEGLTTPEKNKLELAKQFYEDNVSDETQTKKALELLPKKAVKK